MKRFYDMVHGTCMLAMLALFAAVGCANKAVTLGGEPAEGAAVIVAANRIYNVETGLVLAGEVALAARAAGKINDTDWGRVADRSAEASAALEEAKRVLVQYQALRDSGTATRMDAALGLVESLLASFTRLAVSFREPPIIGALVPVGG